MTEPPAAQPTLPVLPGPAGESLADILDTLRRALALAAPAWLPRQRWFGDKTRTIARVDLRDGSITHVGPDPIALLVAEVAFADGGAADYFVPLILTAAAVPPAAILATVEGVGGGRLVADALAHPIARAWLLDQLAAGDRHHSSHGAFVWRPASGPQDPLPAARTAESRVSTAEQSNSAIVYGGALMLKVFRKLQPGLNPDIEIGRFLAARTSFRNAPSLLGDLTYLPSAPDAPETSLAMAQPFVASLGDGWSVILDRLAAHNEPSAVSHQPSAVALAARLGQRTAQLHLALASDTTDPAFAPELIGSDDTRRWSDDLAAALDRTIANLQARPDRLPDTLRDRVLRLAPDDPDLARRAQGFAALVGAAKTRVHGDYHLGQSLVTPDGDVVLIDFEGEPARSLAERRQKTSPLKDVAGMLRSFGYARAAATRSSAGLHASTAIERSLLAWEQRARSAFLDAYLAECRPVTAPFLPTTPEAFATAVAAWELDKAVYEVNYELNNRPDWLWLPLSTLLAH